MKKIFLMKSSWTKSLRNNHQDKTVLFLLNTTLIILLSACGGQDARSTPEYFIPPTLSPLLYTPTPNATPTFTPSPTDEAPCENGLAFIDDVTIPDDTVVAPAQEFEKVWLLENSGTCNWEMDYSLRLVDGLAMGASSIIALRPTVSGKQVEISITFFAPTDAGRAFSKWQAHDPEGNPFGDEFFVQVIVDPNYQPDESGN
jgi:hypothetical protein